MTKSTVAILLTDHSPKLTPKFGTFAEQTAELLKNSGSSLELKTYDAIRSQFPSERELNDIKTIWITGSAFDSFQNDIWIFNLMKFIQEVYFLYDHISFVGICFGHQIITRALGGEVGRNPKSWELGIYDVQLSEKQEVRDLFEGAEQFQILQIHQDIVTKPPQVDCVSIGYTEATQYQGFYKKGKLLTLQGHPEFKNPILRHMAQDLYDINHINHETFKHASVSLNKEHEDFDLNLGRIIVTFIESP